MNPSKTSISSVIRSIDWTPHRIRMAIFAVVLLVVYLLLRPSINNTFGLSLPGIFEESNSTEVADSDGNRTSEAGSSSTTVEKQPLGLLTEVGSNRFQSTAGLIYAPARGEHRIEHVMRHALNDRDRPVHGVFSATQQEQVLALIDEAFLLAREKGPPDVEIEEQNDRTVYTIDLGRTIGYMGGQAGARRENPQCRHLQLVLEGNEVITAYPVIPR